MVSDRRQHGSKVVASGRQRQEREFVEYDLPVGDGGKQPVEVVLVDALREEGDNSEEVTGVGAEVAERRRSEREFDGGCQALVVVCLQYL